MRKNPRHTIDILFALALFCAFAASVLLVLMTGAGVYQNTIRVSKERFEERVCVSYIATKIRHTNTLNAVSIKDFGDGKALVLSETIEDIPYSTYIYTIDGNVRELFCETNLEMPPDESDPRIATVEFLDFEFVKGNLLKVTCTGLGGKTEQLFLSIYSSHGEGMG